jgi:hypothetical protein
MKVKQPLCTVDMRNRYCFVSFSGKKQLHKYVCIIQNEFITDEIEVMSLKFCSDSKSTFKADESDFSIIKTCQILQMLPVQILIGSRDHQKYSLHIVGYILSQQLVHFCVKQ